MKRPRITNPELLVIKRCIDLVMFHQPEDSPVFTEMLEARIKVERIIAWNEYQKDWKEERDEQARRKFGRA